MIDGSAYYNKENVFMTGIAYDSRTNFMCAGFPSLKRSNPVRIGCFDTKKYAPGSSPVFKPFPSYRDNDLPVSVKFILCKISILNHCFPLLRAGTRQTQSLDDQVGET